MDGGNATRVVGSRGHRGDSTRARRHGSPDKGSADLEVSLTPCYRNVAVPVRRQNWATRLVGSVPRAIGSQVFARVRIRVTDDSDDIEPGRISVALEGQ